MSTFVTHTAAAPIGNIAPDDGDGRKRTASQRILDEAERLFRHYGYTKTTVADIARELGMSPANIYRFFPSKTAIHEALAERMVAGSEVMLHEIAKRPVSAEERLRAAVLSQYQATTTQMLAETKVHEMVAVALEEHWPVIERHLQRVTQIVAGMIAEGVAGGEFPEQDIDKAARCFKAAVISVCHPSVVAQCRMNSDRATPEELADFVMKALKG